MLIKFEIIDELNEWKKINGTSHYKHESYPRTVNFQNYFFKFKNGDGYSQKCMLGSMEESSRTVMQKPRPLILKRITTWY